MDGNEPTPELAEKRLLEAAQRHVRALLWFEDVNADDDPAD
jgi:hypothetical protein